MRRARSDKPTGPLSAWRRTRISPDPYPLIQPAPSSAVCHCPGKGMCNGISEPVTDSDERRLPNGVDPRWLSNVDSSGGAPSDDWRRGTDAMCARMVHPRRSGLCSLRWNDGSAGLLAGPPRANPGRSASGCWRGFRQPSGPTCGGLTN